jgi:hypothetical protein
MKTNVTALAVATLATALLSSCASPPTVGSREEAVRAYFGSPTAQRTTPEGTKVLDYSRAPLGHENWRVTVGKDGTVQSVRQLLAEDNFVNVRTGMTKAQVEEQLGRHGETMAFPNLGEEVWSWRFWGGQSQPMFFNAHFDNAGRLKYTTRTEEIRPAMEEGS